MRYSNQYEKDREFDLDLLRLSCHYSKKEVENSKNRSKVKEKIIKISPSHFKYQSHNKVKYLSDKLADQENSSNIKRYHKKDEYIFQPTHKKQEHKLTLPNKTPNHLAEKLPNKPHIEEITSHPDTKIINYKIHFKHSKNYFFNPLCEKLIAQFTKTFIGQIYKELHNYYDKENHSLNCTLHTMQINDRKYNGTLQYKDLEYFHSNGAEVNYDSLYSVIEPKINLWIAWHKKEDAFLVSFDIELTEPYGGLNQYFKTKKESQNFINNAGDLLKKYMNDFYSKECIQYKQYYQFESSNKYHKCINDFFANKPLLFHDIKAMIYLSDPNDSVSYASDLDSLIGSTFSVDESVSSRYTLESWV